MEKEQDISLLRSPKDTPMYFVQLDRTGYAISIEKVLYVGYKEGSRIDSYEEPGKIKYHEWSQPIFYITFKKSKGAEFTITVDNIPYWTGLRAFNTDEHYACGKASYPFVDYYFTTSKQKLLSFLEREKYIDKLKHNVNALDKAWNFITELYKEQ